MKKNNVTRKELAESVSEKLGYPLSTCSEIVDTLFSTMKSSMLDGSSIKLVHFGTFLVRDKSPRKGRNPRTGESITIKKTADCKFQTEQEIKSTNK